MFGGPSPFGQPFGQFGAPPMFNMPAGSPQYVQPFNMQGASPMMQIGGSLLYGMFAGGTQFPGQFSPQQSLLDQMRAQEQYAREQAMMRQVSERESERIRQLIEGGMRIYHGRQLSPQERGDAAMAASDAASWMPMLHQLGLGNQIDSILGRQGSAIGMSRGLFSTMRASFDPISGQYGMTDRSASMISGEVFERMFGSGANISAMAGMNASEAGQLYSQLAMRGLAGPMPGVLSWRDRMQSVTSPLDEGTITRIAERLPEIEARRSAGKEPTRDELDAARGRVRGTVDRIIEANAAGKPLSREEVQGLAGGEDVMRLGNVNQIVSATKKYSGAIAAMKDLFGDAGKIGAIPELFNGLMSITQGRMGLYSDGQLQRMVQDFRNMANMSGIGVQGGLALMGQVAGLADRMGVDRALVPDITTNMMGFGAAAARGGIPGGAFGHLGVEELTLLDGQLRVAAAKSPAANNLNTLLRLGDAGMLSADGNSQASRMLRDVRAGKYDPSMLMSPSDFMAMIQRDAGLSASVTRRIMGDVQGNQEMDFIHKTSEGVRRVLQPEEAARRMSPALASSFRDAFRDNGIAGMLGTGSHRAQLEQQIAADVMRKFMNMDAATLSDRDLTREGVANAIRGSLVDRLGAGPGGRAAEMLGDKGMKTLVEDFLATANSNALNPAFKGRTGMAQAFGYQTFAVQGRLKSESTALAELANAMAPLGREDLWGRLGNFIANYQPGQGGGDFLKGIAGAAVGMVDLDRIAGTGQAGKVMLSEMRVLDRADRDANGQLTDKGQAQVRRSARIISALASGGKEAADLMDELGKTNELTPDQREALSSAATKGVRDRLNDAPKDKAKDGTPTDKDSAENKREIKFPDKISVKITGGNIRLNKDGTANVSLDGVGDFNHNDVTGDSATATV